MIHDADTYRKAMAWAVEYHRRIKDGTATLPQQRRYRDIMDHILVWDWASQAKRPAEPVITTPRSAVAVRFADWYERVRSRPGWNATDWVTAWLYWSGPQDVDEEDQDDAERELAARGLLPRAPYLRLVA